MPRGRKRKFSNYVPRPWIHNSSSELEEDDGDHGGGDIPPVVLGPELEEHDGDHGGGQQQRPENIEGKIYLFFKN